LAPVLFVYSKSDELTDFPALDAAVRERERVGMKRMEQTGSGTGTVGNDDRMLPAGATDADEDEDEDALPTTAVLYDDSPHVAHLRSCETVYLDAVRRFLSQTEVQRRSKEAADAYRKMQEEKALLL